MAQPQRPRLTTSSEICTLVDEQGHSIDLPRYRHSPLPPGRTIRLLKKQLQAQPWPLSRLSSMNEYSLVEYELENTDVTRLDVSNSLYVAMSYSWGKPIFDAPLIIMVQGQRTVLPVTGTAWEAVQRTLPAIGRHGKLMWIDQICIDQDKEREREQQVMLMGEIYRRCWHCMIWLGPAAANTQAAFSLLNRLQQTFGQTKPMPLDERQVADFSHLEIRAELALKLERDVLPPPNDAGWVEMAKLLQRNWFTRLWTFQEAVLCYKGDASIHCGIYNIPLITFMRASMLMGNEPTFARINFTTGRCGLAQISSFRFHVERGNVTPLVWLLQNNDFRECSDPRDRIYALLGMRNEDGPEFPIRVDYHETSAQALFMDTARKIIRSQRSLRICADAAERVAVNGISDLPSWVPDWTRMPLTKTFESLNPSISHFNASNGLAHVDDMQSPKFLIVEGRIIDSVQEIIDTEVPEAVTESERRNALVDKVIPLLLGTLQSWTPVRDHAMLAHTIVNTLTIGGYTRTNNLGNSGVQLDAWTESACGHMLSFVLKTFGRDTQPPQRIDTVKWLHVLTREALHCTNRRFAVLEHNLLALVPKLSRINDVIAILHGSSLPFILTDTGNGYYKMVGACYVDKIVRKSMGKRVTRTT